MGNQIKIMKRYFRFFLLSSIIFILFFLLNLREAYAYIDPGAGSYVVEIIIATLLGALFAVKLFWHRIKAILFRRKYGENKN